MFSFAPIFLQETCKSCHNYLDTQNKCNVCPLVQRLICPQAPTISSQNGFKWASSDQEEIIVQVVHSQRDGWQNTCPVTLFVTTDGSEPSANFYHFTGKTPLGFGIAKSSCVRAVAVSEHGIYSVQVQQDFECLASSGIGLLLEKMKGYKVDRHQHPFLFSISLSWMYACLLFFRPKTALHDEFFCF
jgi:hypothetical protein